MAWEMVKIINSSHPKVKGKSMLGKRYDYDGKPLLKLNDLQAKMKRNIDSKIRGNVYQFETAPCCICGRTEFEPLASKDRYGLFMPVVICRTCGLVQTNPRMNAESYLDFYNREYRKLYEAKEVPTDEFFKENKRRGERIFNFIYKHRLLPKPINELYVLEVGCGAGGILQYFKEKECRVKGFDIGGEYIEFGKAKYEMDLSVGTIADLKYNEPFDLIIYSHVFEHLIEPNEELSHVYNHLASNGILYLELPGIKNLMQSYNIDFLKYLQNAHTYHFSLATLNYLLRKNAFKLVIGDEKIRSVFNKLDSWDLNKDIVSDYMTITNYLSKVEMIRRFLPFAPYQLINFPKRRLIRILQTLGLHNVVRSLYRKLRRRI